MAAYRTKRNSYISQQVPVLARKEVTTARELGSGGFCSVSTIRKIMLNPQQEVNLVEEEKEARARLSRKFSTYEKIYYDPNRIVVPGRTEERDPLEQRPPRIALKELKSNLPAERYKIGVRDLMAEIAILARCQHPNIISIYAVGCDFKTDNTTNAASKEENGEKSVLSSSLIANRRLSFAIIDQLRSTLRSKIQKWKNDQSIQFMKPKQFQRDLWLERLVVILKISDAVSYLHSKKIIHRDINPENIGFGDDDVLKLFDFGLAKTVVDETVVYEENNDTAEVELDDDQLFNLTGTTGTLRYMAPEVGLDMPYGFKADIYSVTLVMYECLSLKKPYMHVQPQIFVEQVMKDGIRPDIENENFPPKIKQLLRDGWASDIGKRPTALQIVERLGELLRGKDENLYPINHGVIAKFDALWKRCV